MFNMLELEHNSFVTITVTVQADAETVTAL